MNGQTYTVYCNQFYLDEPQTGTRRQKKHPAYFYRPVAAYPFVLETGETNTGLYGAISDALSVYFNNAYYPELEGELWVPVWDEMHQRKWGMFVCSSRSFDSAKGMLLHFALCPAEITAALSREELVSVLLRANLIREWGAVRIHGRVSKSAYGNFRTEALLNELLLSRAVQLVYGATTDTDASVWLEHVWMKQHESGHFISCFYSYLCYPIELFAYNGARLPQLMLFPGDPFVSLQQSGWKTPIPLRGNAQERAMLVSISPAVGSSAGYGLIFFPSALRERIAALKGVPKNLGNAIQLDENNLRQLIALADANRPEASDGKRWVLYSVSDGHQYEITRTPYWIGRSAEADCVLPERNGRASRKHACILGANGAFSIVDQSANGTIVNGKRLKKGERAALTHRTRIMIGEDQLLFLERS